MPITPGDVKAAVQTLRNPVAVIVVIGGPTDYEFVSERHPQEVAQVLRYIADQIESRPAVL